MKKVQVTQDGFEQLQAELKDLVERQRPANIARLQHARTMGDFRENSEYSASKEEQGLIEGRIMELEQLIKNSEIVTASGNTNVVQLGCQVEVELSGKKEIYHIVGDYEADPMNKKLSQGSPIGKALVGKKVGDTVDVQVPVGKMTFKIIEIKQS